jgi:hypothetical protein
MTQTQEISFTVAEVDYKVRQPSLDESRQAQSEYNRVFNLALKSDSPLEIKVPDILKKQGLWSDKQESEYTKLRDTILEKEFVLHKGGIYKSEARKIAIELRGLRRDMEVLFSPIANFRSHTCEGQAQNAKFDYLVSVCVVYSDGRPYFTNYEDYLNRSNDAVAILGAAKFAELHYRLTEDFQSELPENQFLKEHGFVDDKNRLVDNKGRLISEDGRLINEDNNLVDEDRNLIDILGHKIDKEGNFVVERTPFLDDSADSVKDSATTKKSKK